MEYGYIRVSTKEQNEQRQLIAMQEFGITGKQIFMDKQGVSIIVPNAIRCFSPQEAGLSP